MFTFDHLPKEISALTASNANYALLLGLPPHLLTYANYSMAQTLEKQIGISEFTSINQLKEALESGVLDGDALKVDIGEELIEKEIIDLGYEKVDRTWQQGDYSWYGDVIVIWPKGFRELVRISLFDDEVEEISLIDAQARRKVSQLKSINIDHFQEVDPERSGVDENQNKVGNRHVEGVIFNERLDVEFLYVPALSMVEAEQMGIPIIDLGLKSIPLISQVERSINVLETVVKKYVKNKYRVLVLDQDIHRYHNWSGYVKNMSEYYKVDPELLDLLSKGFIDEINNEVVLTPYEVFGEIDLLQPSHLGIPSEDIKAEENIDNALLRANEEIFKKLQPGDFIVHEDHGVGLYTGVIEREEGVYMELKYSGKDKLFIPLTQAVKITKYIGSSKEPKLTPLNSGAWRRVRKRAEEDAEKLARELIKLYAIRKTVEIPTGKSIENDQKMESFIDSFKFQDTEDQVVATNEILRDMKRSRPMDRLLIGDVGFGKTEVAMRAMYLALLQGYQVAFLAPTTVLVEQHRAVLEARFEEFGIKVSALSRFLTTAQRNEVVEQIGKGEVDLVVGTHSLLSDDVHFKELGLIVIDEEQKFGVKQKEMLKGKRVDSHVLSLSATPIPRTLNMSLSGIRDISTIVTPPHGRLPIENSFSQYSWKDVNNAIKFELERDGQVYFLHNRVKNIDDYALKLQSYFPDHQVDVAHGQMNPATLSKVMYRFGKGEIDILVCTTIIENGIDMPNVNTLIVDRSEMFGLAQLYQIRGRIGRSDRQAYAHFFYNKLRGDAPARMDALSEASNLGSGFIIASRDMEIRGAGEILGKEQSGAISGVGYGMYITLLHSKIEEMKKSA